MISNGTGRFTIGQRRQVQDQFIYISDDVLRMLDALLAGSGGAWWNEFFADHAKPCPFFVEWPDENLVAWFSDGRPGLGVGGAG